MVRRANGLRTRQCKKKESKREPMLHKGKLQTALNAKRAMFTSYDGSFSDQLNAYRHALETLYLHYSSGAKHEQARQWAECIEGITTLAVDGSQLQPRRDASIPVALIQVGFFANPHLHGRPYTKDVRMEVLAPDEIVEVSRSESIDPDSYPYSELQVTLRRYALEIETICHQME